MSPHVVGHVIAFNETLKEGRNASDALVKGLQCSKYHLRVLRLGKGWKSLINAWFIKFLNFPYLTEKSISPLFGLLQTVVGLLENASRQYVTSFLGDLHRRRENVLQVAHLGDDVLSKSPTFFLVVAGHWWWRWWLSCCRWWWRWDYRLIGCGGRWDLSVIRRWRWRGVFTSAQRR